MPAVAVRRDRRSVSFRLPEQALALVDRAAARVHEDRTSFVLHAIVERAENVLRDQTVFRLDDEAYAAFVAALDSARAPTRQLKALARKRPLWKAT